MLDWVTQARVFVGSDQRASDARHNRSESYIAGECPRGSKLWVRIAGFGLPEATAIVNVLQHTLSFCCEHYAVCLYALGVVLNRSPMDGMCASTARRGSVCRIMWSTGWRVSCHRVTRGGWAHAHVGK